MWKKLWDLATSGGITAHIIPTGDEGFVILEYFDESRSGWQFNYTTNDWEPWDLSAVPGDIAAT